MSEKCNKYESLFVFGTKEQLEEHLVICPECREQHEKMDKTANIAKEAAFHYKNYGKKNHYIPAIKIAAGLVIITLVLFTINTDIINIENKDHNLASNAAESVISEMGLPTDEYGLLMVY